MGRRAHRRGQEFDGRRPRALRGGPGKSAEVAELIGRYGDAIERDLAFRTSYRLSDFYRGNEPVNTLWNLLDALQSQPDSYLAQARATDLDLYERMVEVGRINPDAERKPQPPNLTDVGFLGGLLMGCFEQLQLIHRSVQSTGGVPKGKLPKVQILPRPVTAADLYRQRQALRQYKAVQAAIVFVPDSKFLADQEVRKGA